MADEPATTPVRRPHGKGVPWRSDPEVLRRLPEVEARHLRRMPRALIAQELRISEATVKRDLAHIGELWRERVGVDVADLKARAVRELDGLRELAMTALAFDQAAERAVLFDEPVTLGGRQLRVYRDAKGSAEFRSSKAALIAQARQAVMDQAKLLGLVVEKVSPTNAAGGDLPFTITIARIANDGNDGTA